MFNHEAYYFENNTLKRFYCKHNNRKFKTRDKYLDFVDKNNLQLETINIFRKARFSQKYNGVQEGEFVPYQICKGTIVYDERDFSMYHFNDLEEAEEFLSYYVKDPDVYLQQCYYDGYPGDEVHDVELMADKIVAELPDVEFDASKENKVFAHFICSYLPDNERRQTRLECHKKQIKIIKNITPTTRIYIVAQNYREEDYIDDPQITYLSKYDIGIGAQQARNEMFKFLYESDYEYGIFSDDDAILVPTENTKRFYKDVEEYVERFTSAPVDVCYARNLQYDPFKPGDILNKAVDQHWMMYYNPFHWLCWAMIRNFKKAYGVEEYQDETIDPTILNGYDDIDFGWSLVQKGYRSYQMPLLQFIAYNNNEFKSAIFDKTKERPLVRVKNILITKEKFLKRNSQGHFDHKEFRERVNHPLEIKIPRTRVSTPAVLEFVSGQKEKVYNVTQYTECISTNKKVYIDIYKEGFYYQDHHLYNYYCYADGKNFKTKEEYDAYVEEYDLEVYPKKIWKRAKHAKYTESRCAGKYIVIENATPDFKLWDERIFSHYYFKDKLEAVLFVMVYLADKDMYIDESWFEGFDGDEIYDPNVIVENNIKENTNIIPFDVNKENKKFAHFIISYLPNDEELKKERLEVHHKQIDNIKTITPHTKIYICAQNYKEEDYLIDPQIVYFKHDKGIGAQAARNELLEFLYESNYEYGILSDDDGYLVPSDSAKQFFVELEQETDKFINNRIDIVYSRQMRYYPFSKYDIDVAEVRDNNWTFTMQPNDWMTWMIVRNFNKAYGNKDFMRLDRIVKRDLVYDDLEFNYALARKYHSYRCPILQLYMLNEQKSKSVIYTDVESPLFKKLAVDGAMVMAQGWNDGYADYHTYWTELAQRQPKFVEIPRTITGDTVKEYVGRPLEEIKLSF